MHSNRGRLLASTLFTAVALAGVAGVAMTLSVPTVASAQDLTTGTLEGRFVNEKGAPVSGVKVTVTSNSRGFTQTFTTDANGIFRLTQAPIGSYKVTAEAAGYPTFVDNDLMVNLGQVSHYDLPLAQTSTEVSAVVVAGVRRAPSVDFDRATTGVVINVQQQADRLPVQRDIQGILSLAPQITISKAFSASQLGTRPDNPVGDATISGSSAAENIFYINGMNVTNFRNFLGGATVPFDFYDQIEVKTGGYSAEYGRSTGGAIIAVTRSGSNEFHGGINGYWTPQGLRARTKSAALTAPFDTDSNAFLNSYSLPLDKDNKSYEGNIWLSGPIWKDKLFFFGFYNPRHFEVVTGQSSTANPTQPNDFSNRVPDVYDVVTRDDPFYGGRLDFNLTDRQRFTATMFRDDQNSLDENFLNDGSGNFSKSKTNNLSGGLNKIFNYTGRFTDWFTLSALYGESTFKQSSIGELDADAAVVTETSGGSIVRGNPNLLIATGLDFRKNYRVDGDFYFNAYGSHHVRIGYDKEELTATQNQQYSGGVYYRYFAPGGNCTPTAGCVRVRKLFNIGSYSIEQQGYYLQDAWTATDRLSFNLGVRVEDFNNFNAGGESFIHLKDQVAPRISATYDLFGDRSTKISAFWGRYHLPIAGNTNIRGSGGETFQEDFYNYSSRDATTLVPTLSSLILHRCLEGTDTGSACTPQFPAPDTLRSGNLKPQYQDEAIVGIEHIFKSNWRVSANLIYRKLQQVLEDANLDNPEGFDPDPDSPDRNQSFYCVYAHISAHDCGSFGNSGYVLINPGEDVTLRLNDTWGARAGQLVTIPAAVTRLPKAKRDYAALELKVSRPWDGKWTVEGSYVLSRSRGNYEGGVKSDNSQPDTGGTQDFDEPGWMIGSTGLLPNDHRHQFKVAGAYQLMERLRVGGNLQVISPRHYGCIGYFPPNFPLDSGIALADSTTLTAWFCNGVSTPRGSQFKGDWTKQLDVNLVYDLKAPGVPGQLQLRADIFNLLNEQDAVLFNEFGETGGFGNKDFAYRTPRLYNDPRTIRVGVNYKF